MAVDRHVNSELVRKRQERHAHRQIELEAERKLEEARAAYESEDLDEAVTCVCEAFKIMRHMVSSSRKRQLKAEADRLTDSIVWLSGYC